jgi:LPS export ABC transporter protein LptC
MRSAAQRKNVLRRRVLAALATVAGFALLYGIFVAPGGDEIESTAADEPRGYYLLDATMTEMGADGLPRLVVRAKSIEQQLADQSVLLSDLALDYRTESSGTWTLTSENGRMPVDQGSLQLSGNVEVRGTEARGAAVIRTERLAYDTRSGIIQTTDPVTVQFGAHELAGRGLRVALNDGTLRLESNVHGRFNP